MLNLTKYLLVIECLNPYNSIKIHLLESKNNNALHSNRTASILHLRLCTPILKWVSTATDTSVGLHFKADCVFLFLATAPTVKQLVLALAEWLATRSALCPSMLRSKSAMRRSDNCHRVWCGAADHMLEAALVVFYFGVAISVWR